MSIGKKLKALRGERTQKKVADNLNITKSALAMYERDKRVPRDEIKVRIANYYGETVQSIFLQSKSTNSAQLRGESTDKQRKGRGNRKKRGR